MINLCPAYVQLMSSLCPSNVLIGYKYLINYRLSSYFSHF